MPIDGLDRYLTQSNEPEEMYCPLCSLPSSSCEEELEHEGHWETWGEHAREEAIDLAQMKWQEEK